MKTNKTNQETNQTNKLSRIAILVVALATSLTMSGCGDSDLYSQPTDPSQDDLLATFAAPAVLSCPGKITEDLTGKGNATDNQDNWTIVLKETPCPTDGPGAQQAEMFAKVKALNACNAGALEETNFTCAEGCVKTPAPESYCTIDTVTPATPSPLGIVSCSLSHDPAVRRAGLTNAKCKYCRFESSATASGTQVIECLPVIGTAETGSQE